MILASLLSEDIYRHKNGLKHINIINDEGFSAVFVVNTPVFDNSGVAHAVEHMIFRGSTAFPQPETLFQLTSLTDAKINASTLTDTTYFHCQSQCEHSFMLAINYLLNGLFDPIFDADDLRFEIHDGNDKGVIYQELIGIEQAKKETTESINKNNEKNKFCYGGISTSIGELSLNDLTVFHQRFYQASNITLVTANADIEQISNLISLLPNQHNQSKQIKVELDKYITNKQDDESNEHQQPKYSQAINKLITIYHLWLQDPYYQEIDDYKEIEHANKPLVIDIDTLPMLPKNNLIPALATLSNKLIAETITEKTVNRDIKNNIIKKTTNKTLLPSLLNKLYQQAKRQLNTNKLSHHSNQTYASEQRNALWLTGIDETEQAVANISSYIISAYPKFLAPRCQGSCYATQALTIEKSTYLAIYSAFDVDPTMRLKDIIQCLLKLSQDNTFISMSLSLAKIKYCQAYQVKSSLVTNITSTDISTYLLAIANRPHPKV